ncbi:Alpha/Beta hydrolase protein [Lineolata rhizophorae]|uniref:Alpha/Beta hydrolase protein n=1 Tax=Lineolata rhizophorae TaxID=578093 RepID=A0A6A6NQ91_9PEZI|nr:Alpha/Beta hydrolase protein [Lineolata rhizophorae]
MARLGDILRYGFWSLSALGGLYVLFVASLIHPDVQRFALYAHKISAFWQNLDRPEAFGFARNQVTPFNITTVDGETLYAWHILPLDLYAQNQEDLTISSAAPVDYLESKPFKLLRDDPEARLVINFHGNAGHIAQGWRPDTYRALSSLRPSVPSSACSPSSSSPHTHVLAFDYRGFGRSSGSPSEPGLVADGVAAARWAIDVARVEPRRIVLLGQSLGTAVATGVAEAFALGEVEGAGKAAEGDGHGDGAAVLEADEEDAQARLGGAIPPAGAAAAQNAWRSRDDDHSSSGSEAEPPPTFFASLILVSPFTSLPELLHDYRIFGAVPVLNPLKYTHPRVLPFLQRCVRERWETGERLARAVARAAGAPAGQDPDGGDPPAAPRGSAPRFNLHVIHAATDPDIGFRHGEAVYSAAVRAAAAAREPERRARDRVVSAGRHVVWRAEKGPSREEWWGGGDEEEGEGDSGRLGRLGLSVVGFGGHNRVVTYAPVGVAVLRGFEVGDG